MRTTRPLTLVQLLHQLCTVCGTGPFKALSCSLCTHNHEMSRFYHMHRIVYYCAGGMLALTFVPHAAPSLLMKSCELAGSEAPRELVLHVKEIAAALELPHPERIRVFITNGFSSVSGGCTLLPRGAIIGLPRTVLYKEEEDIRGIEMLLEGQPMDWDSPTGAKLAKLLSPSTQSTNFRIAHEVEHLKNYDFLPSILMPPVVLIFGYHFATLFSKFAFPKRYRTASFPILFSLTLVLYLQLATSVRHWQEHRADREAASCHASYAQGGIELMKKHAELESLLRRPPSKHSMEHFMNNFSTHPPFPERLRRLEAMNSLRNST